MTTMRKMTAEEFALLCELARWLRNSGAQRGPYGAMVRLGDGRTIAWETVGALHWPRAGEVGVHPDRHRPLSWCEVENVTQGVDVLVALGYLPMRFSSAYRAGWDASAAWHGEVDDATFARMFHDPEHIAFPAVGAAW